MTRPIIDVEGLARELAGLSHLNRADLLARWRALYGASPLPRSARSLMIRAIAHKLQERAHGGLSPATRRFLAGLDEAKPPLKLPPASLRPGTVLVREWQGVTHRVTVIEDGVIYQGKRFGSLSEVARAITGSRWSGPRFFGLKGHARA